MVDTWDFMDRAMGCLSGGACGDALGYPVESLSRTEIACRYGSDGITGFDPVSMPVRVSDGTQMTVLTAWGIIRGGSKAGKGLGIVPMVYAHYRMWARAQGYDLQEASNDALTDPIMLYNPWLRDRRASDPGYMDQLIRSASFGTVDSPINDSMGCEGLASAAPVAIAAALRPVDDAMDVTAGIAATICGHPRGWLPAALMSAIIWYELHGSDPEAAVESALSDGRRMYSDVPHWDEVDGIVSDVVSLSGSVLADQEAEAAVGHGQAADEVLATAVLACLRHEDNFRAALVTAVNIDGDSASVGAAAGSILGARLGRAGVMSGFDPLLLECDDFLSVTLFMLAPVEVLEAIGRERREDAL